MDPNKRLFENHNQTPSSTTTTNTKRRHQHPLPNTPNTTIRTPIKISPNETLFRILCPTSKTGALIGKGGATIRLFREQTAAKIRIDDYVPGSEERVIFISAHSNPNPRITSSNENSGEDTGEESDAQKVLVRVFEKILRVDEGREGGGDVEEGNVVCRMLVSGNQIGCVLGRGGKVIEKIRVESGAQVRVLSKDQVPECASPGDELIQGFICHHQHARCAKCKYREHRNFVNLHQQCAL